MSTTTGTAVWYDKGKGAIVGGTINLDTPDIRVLLLNNTYTPAVTTDTHLSDIVTGHEVTTNGASRLALTAEAKTEVSAGLWMLDSNDPAWTAAGGSIVAKYWCLYNYNASDALAELICYGLLDSGGGDVTTTVGNVLTVAVHANGWFRWT